MSDNPFVETHRFIDQVIDGEIYQLLYEKDADDFDVATVLEPEIYLLAALEIVMDDDELRNRTLDRVSEISVALIGVLRDAS